MSRDMVWPVSAGPTIGELWSAERRARRIPSEQVHHPTGKSYSVAKFSTEENNIFKHIQQVVRTYSVLFIKEQSNMLGILVSFIIIFLTFGLEVMVAF